MSLGAGVLTLMEGQAILRAEGDIHSNPESSHNQSHCHSETIRGMLTNPRLTRIGKLGKERLLSLALIIISDPGSDMGNNGVTKMSWAKLLKLWLN